MKRISDAAKGKRKHGVDEVITYIKEELKFSNTVGLNDVIETVRKRMTQPKKKNAKKENITAVWAFFESLCTELGLGKEWIALLRYHLETLEKELGNLRKNDPRIDQNANVLAEAALRFTVMVDALSTNVFRGYPFELFCVENVKQLVKTPNDLKESFPSAQNDNEVKCFADKMEWTSLVCHINPHIDLDVPSLKESVEIGKIFATRGVRSDEVHRAEKVKQQLKDISKQDMRIREWYVAKALGLTAGHWFECSNGHLYAIGDCGDAEEKSLCPECKERDGGNNNALPRNNRSPRGLIKDEARPSWSTVLAPRPIGM